MKHYSLLLASLLLVLSGPLSAQVVSSRTDSIVGYVFTTTEDSVRNSIRIFTRTDSIIQYENEWLGYWNADSARCLAMSKYARTFDKDGNLLLYTWTHKSGEYGWIVLDSIRTDYNASGQVTFLDAYHWDEGQQSLIGHDREEYFRDASGNDTLRRSSEWYSAFNDWRYSNLRRNKFDQENRFLEGIVYNWDWNLEEWVLNGGQRNEYILDASGNVETEIQYNLNRVDMIWDTVTRVEYTYNDSGHMLSEEGFVRIDGNWVLRFKQEWDYDADGNIILHIPYWWDHQQDTLVYRLSYVCSYDSQGRLLQRDNRVWDPAQKAWLLDLQTRSRYNENGQIISYDFKDWNVLDGGEFNHYRIEYLYTVDEKDSVWIHLWWDADTQQLMLSYKSFYHYGVPDVKDYTGLPLQQSPQFTLYPVPVRDLLMIESEVPAGRMDLLDLKGRIVLSSGRIDGGVDLSSLESGIYLLRLFDQSGIPMGTRKILKE